MLRHPLFFSCSRRPLILQHAYRDGDARPAQHGSGMLREWTTGCGNALYLKLIFLGPYLQVTSIRVLAGRAAPAGASALPWHASEGTHAVSIVAGEARCAVGLISRTACAGGTSVFCAGGGGARAGSGAGSDADRSGDDGALGASISPAERWKRVTC